MTTFDRPMHSRHSFVTRAGSVLSLAALLLTGCAPAVGQFTWAGDYVSQTPGAADTRFTIGIGDLIAVQVFDNDKLSARGRVRADGNLALPLINDVLVVGKTPSQVAADVAAALKSGDLVLNPRVNVVVEEVPQLKITVLGAVARAGTFAVDPGSGVAQALAGAGGLTEFAHKDRIFVLRKLPTPVRIRFRFSSLTDTGPEGSFRLQQGDVIVVE